MYRFMKRGLINYCALRRARSSNFTKFESKLSHGFIVTGGILDSFNGINMQDHQFLHIVFIFVCVYRTVMGLKFFNPTTNLLK